MIKDIRARQHEFDNHMNAILNMHVTIDTYDELVKAQSAYGKSIYDDKVRSDPALLRISDKILAGFIGNDNQCAKLYKYRYPSPE